MVKNHAAKEAARKLKAESGITYPRALDLVRAAKDTDLPANEVPVILHTEQYPRFDDLHLPEAVRDFATVAPGLYVFAGLIGSGRSTSMAAVVNSITERFARRVTIIGSDRRSLEILPGRSEIRHRSVGEDENSMAEAINTAVSEVRDVIVIDDLLRGAALAAAVRAAKAGHTVFMTIHAESAAHVPQRIIERAVAQGVPPIAADLAEVLRGVLFQTLVFATDGYPTVVPAIEMLPVHHHASEMIKALDYRGLAALVSRLEKGCIPLAVSLSQLVLDGMASEEAAEKATGNPMAFRRALHAGKRHSNPYLTLGADTAGEPVRHSLGMQPHLLVISGDSKRRAAAMDGFAARFPGPVTRGSAANALTALADVAYKVTKIKHLVQAHGEGRADSLPREIRPERRCVLVDIPVEALSGEGAVRWLVHLSRLGRDAGVAGVTLLLGVETKDQLKLLSAELQTMSGRLFLDGTASYSSHRGSTVQFSPDWEAEAAAAA